VQSVVHLLHG